MKIPRINFRRPFFIFSGALVLLLFGAAFQNCSRVQFSDMSNKALDSSSTSSLALALQKFTTYQDTPLTTQPKTFSSISLKKAVFIITKQPAHGTLTDFDFATGKFTYNPNTKYYGDDSFEYSEKEEGVSEPHSVPISIGVLIKNDLPTILTDSVGFEMNTIDTQFTLLLSDYNDPSPHAYLSANLAITQMNTKNGIIKWLTADRFSYTPNVNYRGTDQFEFVAINSFGKMSKKLVILNVENPFQNLEPSMAVRGMGCVTCHLNTGSKLISDFGSGDNYFFGKHALSAGDNPFVAPYSFYNDHGGAAFLSATMKEILVPNVTLPFALGSYGLAPAQATATTLPQYVNAIRGSASVTIKSQIYIGAPTVETIMDRTRLGTDPFAYIKNQDSSPDLMGLVNKGSYFEANNLTCDGDLTIKGPLYLKNLVLNTNNGCRIYATGPIFINGKISYSQITFNATNNTNLQLVSAVWINLGVGLTHCENAVGYPATSSTSPNWYKINGAGNAGATDPITNQVSPFYHRMKTYAAPTRNNMQDANTLRSIEQSITGFEDASCRTNTGGVPPREVHFERLMLDAPRIDSRYIGQFDGVVIAEVNLMSLSTFSFTFDPVFNRVPILPLLLPSDYLVVK